MTSALQGYGLTVSQLYDLLLEIRDQYSEILMKRWVNIFNNIFDEDNYTPMMAETEEDYEKITEVYPFSDTKLEAVWATGHLAPHKLLNPHAFN